MSVVGTLHEALHNSLKALAEVVVGATARVTHLREGDDSSHLLPEEHQLLTGNARPDDVGVRALDDEDRLLRDSNNAALKVESVMPEINLMACTQFTSLLRCGGGCDHAHGHGSGAEVLPYGTAPRLERIVKPFRIPDVRNVGWH